MKKLRVGVLMGGKSGEREVSFNSGRTICDHLDTSLYEIIPIFQTQEGLLYELPWRFLHRGKTSDFQTRLKEEFSSISWDSLKVKIDFMYLALHGRDGEDGSVQGFLEILNIPYLGSKVFASALGMDKIIQKDFLRMHGIPVSNGFVVRSTECSYEKQKLQAILEQQIKEKALSFPLFVKPHQEGSSLGVSLVSTMDELIPAINKAHTIDPRVLQNVLVEEKIQGKEFSCIVLTDKNNNPMPLVPTEIVPGHGWFDYDQKYMPGRSLQFTPARFDEDSIQKIQRTCVDVMRALGMTNLARIDGFLKNDGSLVIIDPNSLSGMGPASFLFKQAAEINMNHTQLINHLIETELNFYNLGCNMEGTFFEDKAPKIRVAILFGGSSNEREISLESGRNVLYKLSPQKYTGLPIFVNQHNELFLINEKLLLCNATDIIASHVTPSMKIEWQHLKEIADFVFIALHGGDGENGSCQGALEMLEIPYNGSGILTSALCMNKERTNAFLRSKNFDVPASYLFSQVEWRNDFKKIIERVEKELKYPVIVKPHDDGCSFGVNKASNAQELEKAVDFLFAQKKEMAFVEEYISGMELTVGVLGNNDPFVLPPSQTVSAKDVLSIEEKFLPGAGGNITPAPLSNQALLFIKRTIAAVYATVSCTGYARIDCFYQSPLQSKTGKERLIILEINTLPALTPATVLFHQAAEIGLKPMDLIDQIITLGFGLHSNNKQISRSTYFDSKQQGLSL